MKISVTGFEIIKGNHPAEQAENFMSLFDGFIQQRSLKSEYIIAINFFIFTANNEAYQQHIQELKKQLPEYIRNNVPLTILAHAPANGKKISAELWYIEDPEDVVFSNRITGGNLYRIIQAGKEKLVISGGIEANTRAGNITEAAEKVFQCMEKILIAEGLNFSNIIRQWNYIENITAVDKDDGHLYQHYQQFNNIRSQYYNSTDFKYGYPAATGIGIKSGGVIVSFFAASEKFFSITSLENSLQKSAFEYSREVLIGDKDYRGCTKCPPKFSRAKSIVRGNSEQILISGTASIRGQLVVGEKNPGHQTEITLENIKNLISKSTLLKPEQKNNELPRIDFIRVYIKNPEDYHKVKAICEKHLPGVNSIFVVADICRENLLVEIEAITSSA